ncbi:MAG: glutamate 5-kinase [Bacteroidaceae bacterium]|nr:glutamate 5-kinase [Bacteroidaceae bacterium]MBQ3239227.1 glutamate 5-kinase [Bacteroidaceae bacterium]MBQ7966856.1 glutamate 5-kinase [Bacteroidaceae bacterium]MBR3985331.1 glutamate 5-kinase [Bacteroidaceae bacterium]MBR4041931.1 glutamate 5-kinase [Bacteroidaceae bacterium]
MSRKSAYHRIAVKIGSNVLTRADGTLDVTRMSSLVDQIALLYRQGIEVILISSGAVASGRSELQLSDKLDSVESRQLFSAVGQAKLINRYYELFRDHGIAVGQVLTTKESLATRRSYLNQRGCMRVMLDHGVVPIVNENDTISVTELMFTDNDELSGLVATMMDVDVLIILSNVDGIYDGPPSDAGSKVIRRVEPSMALEEYIQTERSGFGRGGMQTKSRIARKVADEGIAVIIANGRKEDILLHVVNEPEATLCTLFVASEANASSVKKWIAHSDGFAKGVIRLNDKAVEVVLGEKAASILPIGVCAIDGDFEKDDIVHVADAQGNVIGVGRTAYDSMEARQAIGQHDRRPIVHYDYLCIV